MTKNIGQVSGLWIGNTPPENNKLIWFDTGNNLHKSYDFAMGVWIPMTMNPIVSKTYSELQNLAAHNSISQGTFYLITNLGYLALAITSTKIQYTDNNNNVIIDDLISNKTYCVTSENLLIEDKTGVWDVSTNTLKFNFEETNISNEASDITKNDYVLGTKVRNGVKHLSKYKISSLLSTVANNAISWNKGFYLNFLTNLQSYYNQNGGVVRYETFLSAIRNIETLLSQIQININDINIWNKQLPDSFSPQTNPTDIVVGNTLKTIVDKVQGWINKFKTAKGSVLSSDYNVISESVPEIGDTVEEAIGKLEYQAQGLPSNWTPSSDNSNPTVSAGQTFAQAFAKVQRWFNLFWNISSTSFKSKAIANDSLTSVFNFVTSGSGNSMGGYFSIHNPNSSTTINPGRIDCRVSDDETIPFVGQSRPISYIKNNFSYAPQAINNNGNPGTADLDFYTMWISKPKLPKINLNDDQHAHLNNVYALFAESLKTISRSSPIKMVDSADYDNNEGNHLNYEITRESEEHIMFYKNRSSQSPANPDMYINLKLTSLQLGQHIGITFFDTLLPNSGASINLVTNDAGHAMLIPRVNGDPGTPSVGGVSIIFKSNLEYKFVVVDPQTLGYTSISGYLLLCLNSPNIVSN